MRTFAAMFLAFAVACGSDAPSAPKTATVVGSWALQTIGGVALPIVLDQLGEDKLELLEAVVTASTTGSFQSSSTERTTIAGQTTSRSYQEDGSYTTSGTMVTFTFASDNSTVIGVLQGDSLVFTGGGVAVVYRRR